MREGFRAERHPPPGYGTPVPWLVFTNLYVAFCGAALTAMTYPLVGGSARIDAVVGLVFACTLVIYNLDRLIEPHPGDSPHERWVHAHQRLLWALTLAAGLGAIPCLVWLNPTQRLSLIPAGAIAVGYCVPVLRIRGCWLRLKAIPSAKLLLIALVWTYATAVLPMLDQAFTLDRTNTAVLVNRLLFISAVALPFDLPDMQRDIASGIKTLPTLIGTSATRWTALTLAAASGAAGLLTPAPAAYALLVSASITCILLYFMKPNRGVVYFMLLLDGMLLVQAFAIWAIKA